MNLIPGKSYLVIKEPGFSTGGRKGTVVTAVDMGTWIGVKDETLDTIWFAHESELTPLTY